MAAMTIRLSQGFVALVDEEAFARLGRYRWYARRTRNRYYAIRTTTSGDKLYMHREVMGAGPGQQIDHISHDLLDKKIIDNRRCNLRFADHSLNQANRGKGAPQRTSPFKGVSWSRVEKKWKAYIGTFPSRQNLGTFRDEGVAALVYDVAAVHRYGEFAVTNFPVPGSARWLYGPHALAAAIERRGEG